MTPEQAEKALELIDKAGASRERRRQESMLNRRAQVALVVANAAAAAQIKQPDQTAQALEAAAAMLSDPT